MAHKDEGTKVNLTVRTVEPDVNKIYASLQALAYPAYPGRWFFFGVLGWPGRTLSKVLLAPHRKLQSRESRRQADKRHGNPQTYEQWIRLKLYRGEGATDEERQAAADRFGYTGRL